ncbi:electron transport complex subunit RsxC [Gilvimarinus sp. F26214L]|uniref:electron transport complex subunit RsxC n=1 Tax=Gilvimarinus sp. DZF01 TaxID=3461371 RepID=UPI004045880C
MRKIWDIPGGIHPPGHKDQSLALPLAELPLPAQLVLPVSQHLGAPAEPVVAVGDRVLKGQLIAEGKQAISANVHASTSGTVAAIEERPLPHPSGLNGMCIVLDADGHDEWAPLQACEDYRQLEPAQALEKIQAAGIAGMGGAGFPTAVKLDSRRPIEALIVNGTECEPYITADDMLMRTAAQDIVRGIGLLSYLLDEPREILIAVEDNKPDAIAALQNALDNVGDTRMEVVPLPTRYPSGGERQLIQLLTGQELPSGGLPAQLGIVCQNVATVLAAYRAVRFGEPLIERITTVTGDAFATQRNVRARLGTPISFILGEHGYDAACASRLVMGGPMMGFSILNPDAPVIKTTNCLLAPSMQEAPPPAPATACIRCGLCAEACPVNLLPQQLYWFARAQEEEKLKAHNLFDCIECGACSYVCPSHIPLVQYYRAAKGEIRKHEAERRHADRARQRFEFHKQRIEAEKAARLKAREEAQAKARQRKAEAGGEPPANAPKSEKPGRLAAALEKAKQGGAGDERGRLERKLLAADDRLNKLRQKLDSAAEQPEQAEALRARIKEAELASQGIRDKLAALANDPAQPKSATHPAGPGPHSSEDASKVES